MTYKMKDLDDYQRTAVQTLRRWEPTLSVQDSIVLRNCLAIAHNINTIIQHQKLRTHGTMERQSVFTIIGLIGESGEFIDVLKKSILHKQEISPDVIADEAGDVIWYVATTAYVLGYNLSELAAPATDATKYALNNIRLSVEVICEMFAISLSEVLEGNVTKLHKKRYPDGFQFGGGNDRHK